MHRGNPLIGNDVPSVKQSVILVFAVLFVERIVTSRMRNGGTKPRLVVMRLRVRSSITTFCDVIEFVVVPEMLKYGMCPAAAYFLISLPKPSTSARSERRQRKNPVVYKSATFVATRRMHRPTHRQSRRYFQFHPPLCLLSSQNRNM